MPPKTVRIYGISDLVFAKIKGYPPWPARIEEDHPPGYKSTPGRYPVFFFGTYETAVVAAKDLYPYEQYKHQYGIKRKMKHFNEGLEEIEKTPHMSTKDTEDLIRMRDERASQLISADDEDASDSSFQKSDNDNSDISSNESESSVSDDSKKNKKKNGKSKSSLNKSNKNSKRKILSDESEDESDSEVRNVKSKLKEKGSKDFRNKTKNGSQKNKSDLKNKGKVSKKSLPANKGKAKKRIKEMSDSEVSKSPAEQSDNDSNDDETNSISRTNLRKANVSDSDESSKPSRKSIESDNDKISDKDSDSDEAQQSKKRTKRNRIESNSDSDSKTKNAKKNKDNLDDVIKLKQKLQEEKLAQKLEEKEREKERRKKEKMEQKRLERIKKAQEGDLVSAEGSLNKTIGDGLASIDQSIKLSLSINNANVNKCLDAMESLNDLKITSGGISTFSNQLKELIQTLKKCKKYKADQRVREKADLCLTKLKDAYKVCFVGEADSKCESTNPKSSNDCSSVTVTNEPNSTKDEFLTTSIVENETPLDSCIDDVESLSKNNEDSKESADSCNSRTTNSTPLDDDC